MSDRTTRKAAPKAKTGKPAEPRLSRTRRPAALAVADWQAALRRQFGREQPFGLERIAPKKSVASSPRRRVTGLGRPGADRGGDPVFSDYRVHNRASGSHYRMAIRGRAIGQNFRTCPDFATIDLGTCNHIEFTLAKLESRRGGKAALAALSRCAISLDQRHRKRIRSAR